MDISYCDDKTGFPRPGHIYYEYCLHHSYLDTKMFLLLMEDYQDT